MKQKPHSKFFNKKGLRRINLGPYKKNKNMTVKLIYLLEDITPKTLKFLKQDKNVLEIIEITNTSIFREIETFEDYLATIDENLC